MLINKKCVVSRQYSGERLQNFLKRSLGEEYSGKRIKQLIDSYGCKVNGKVEVFSSYKVKVGDIIHLDIEKLATKEVEFLKVLYEDEELMLCHKPSGMVSDAALFSKRLNNQTLYLAHRLDKETSGVILLAKNKSMLKQLETLFKTRKIEKVYHAIAQGDVAQKEFTVENHLKKQAEYEGQAIWGASSEGLYALTHFKVLKKRAHLNTYLLLECMPFTGRTHQIRVHLAGRDLPILGDRHYHREQAFYELASRPLLHAYSLRFTHPKTDELIEVIAPYPRDFHEAVSKIFSDD
jgi:RluA family pseudouridine synthase